MALISDMKTYKIKNNLILVFVIVGLITNTIEEPSKGLVVSLLGIAIPFVLLFLLYAARMLGAGDIKLLCAVGAIMGPYFVLESMAVSFITGGIIALFIIAIKKNAIQRLRHLYEYLKSCFLTLSLNKYTDFGDKSDGAKFSFAIGISVGTLALMVYKIIK